MRTLHAAAAALVLCASAAKAAPDVTLRVPQSGDVYLQVQAPANWPTERSANGLRIDGGQISVTLALLEDQSLKGATEAQLAEALMKGQSASVPVDAGAVQMAGLNGERFRATLNPGGSQGVPIEVRVARIDATHMLMESVAWQPTTPDNLIDQAWRIVVSGVLVRPKA